MGIAEFERLLTKLHEHFIKNLPERSAHLRNLLTTASSPYHIKSKSPIFAVKQGDFELVFPALLARDNAILTLSVARRFCLSAP